MSVEENIKTAIKSLSHFDIEFDLMSIFKSPQVMNCFFKNINLFKLLINYLIVIHKKDIILDILEYSKNLKDEQLDKMINEFLFYEGLYGLIDIKKLNDNLKLNEMLIFNNQPTTDKHFNEIFSKIKDLTLISYKYNDEIYNNAKINGYNFKFLDNLYKPINLNLSVKNVSPLEGIEYDPEFGNAFIHPYNYDNEIFKRAFYVLCSYQYELSFENCLNVFLNFEKLFYSKNVTVNDSDGSLITYIYFKSDDGYIPNLRYTIDLPTKLPELPKTPEDNTKNDGFNTTIEEDEKGVYFKTNNYNFKNIKWWCDTYISQQKYIDLLIYIFKSQFLSRSTCLFGYYIYYKYTNMIPKEKKYYDIIALTRKKEEAADIISNGFYEYIFKQKTGNLTLQKIIDFIKY